MVLEDFKVGDKVLVNKELYSYEWYDDSYCARNYNVILEIKEIREASKEVMLEDYSLESLKNLKLIKV